jgi:hypothetical protein
MILLLNIARFVMVLWIAYGLLLVFAPSVLHSPPNPPAVPSKPSRHSVSATCWIVFSR